MIEELGILRAVAGGEHSLEDVARDIARPLEGQVQLHRPWTRSNKFLKNNVAIVVDDGQVVGVVIKSTCLNSLPKKLKRPLIHRTSPSTGDALLKFDTKVVRAGITPDPTTGSILPPIYETATYVLEEVGKDKGFDYTRSSNPTRQVLEANLAAIENAK
ncbi:MAG: hypothetical protein CM1200mP18_07700 [Gammaproteobacteria bacterium]|nr:MAG: hypothetical protein CM1200mP18_07700 [Gammaproteobacteria bacterium]